MNQRFTKYAFAVSLLLVALTACHHDSETPAYDLTGRYYSSGIIKATGPIRLFTHQGEITDQRIINRFLVYRLLDPTEGLFATTDQLYPGGKRVKIRFQGGNRATLFTFLPGLTNDSVQVEVTNQQATSFLLQRVDSISYHTSTSVSACDNIEASESYMGQAKPGELCHALSPVSGYSSYCHVRTSNVIVARGSQLYLPYLSWDIGNQNCQAGITGLTNQFDANAFTHLGVNDTLAVQEREVALTRQP